MLKTLNSARKVLLQIEDGMLISMLFVAIVLAVVQIFLRNFFDSGIVWADVLLRVIVLWIGMFGAMYASRNNEHINIELGLKHLSEKVKPYVQAIVFLFTSVVCGIVAWYGAEFIITIEYVDGLMAFSKVPVWVTEAIIPIAFANISIRYLISMVLLFVDKENTGAQ